MYQTNRITKYPGAATHLPVFTETVVLTNSTQSTFELNFLAGLKGQKQQEKQLSVKFLLCNLYKIIQFCNQIITLFDHKTKSTKWIMVYKLLKKIFFCLCMLFHFQYSQFA